VNEETIQGGPASKRADKSAADTSQHPETEAARKGGKERGSHQAEQDWQDSAKKWGELETRHGGSRAAVFEPSFRVSYVGRRWKEVMAGLDAAHLSGAYPRAKSPADLGFCSSLQVRALAA
jgi:hypothetical protein